MLTGAEYARSLRDGRRLRVLGDGDIDDVNTHPATRSMAEHYARWYDRHREPEWQSLLLDQDRRPVAFEPPRSIDALRRLGKAAYAVAFATAGNVTHTPMYGALISLGLLDAVKLGGLPDPRIRAARAFREHVATTGKFVTFSTGTAPVADKFREPAHAVAAHVAKETDGGIVLRGSVGLHTATPFAHDVVVLVGNRSTLAERKAWVAIPVAAPGVRIIARSSARRAASEFTAPYSNRFDELDAALWLDDVFIPSERVFALGEECDRVARESVVQWLFYHQEIGWLARAEFTLGLALAVAHAEGTLGNPTTVEQLVDLVVEVQTIRSLLVASELDAESTDEGHFVPRRMHLAPAALRSVEVRRKLPEILRLLCGASALLAPAKEDLESTSYAGALGQMLEGGGYTPVQRAALYNAAWDHIATLLDAREHSFELFGSGGAPLWRVRIQGWFERYSELANGVLGTLNVEMPTLNLDSLRTPSRPAAKPK